MSTAAEPAEPAAARARDLRRKLRAWRRGHADATLGEVLSEVYVGVFSALIIGSMFVSVLVHLGRRADTAHGNADVVATLPWVGAGAAVLLVVSLARLLGPVSATPAVVDWLLRTPVDRGALLRPRTLVTLAAGTVAAAVLAACALLLGGASALVVVAAAAGAAVVALLLVAAAGAVQATPRGRRASGVVVWLLGIVLAAALILLALGHSPFTAVAHHVPTGAWVAVVVVGLAGLGVCVRLSRRLGSIPGRVLASGASLAAGVSGAMAGLDLALAYDVVLGRRWTTHPPVRSRRGAPAGPMALVAADVVRLRRSPTRLLAPALLVALPYAVVGTPAARAVPLLIVVAGFPALLPLLAGMRVLSRTAGLARLLPFSPLVAGTSAVALPTVVAVCYGLATAPALARIPDVVPGASPALGIACGLGALAAATRWMCGRPPDYGRPLASTPAGGVPTNLYGSVLRGFDIAVLVSVPLLLGVTANTAAISAGISILTVVILVARRPR